MLFLCLALAAALLTIVGLDISKKISLMHFSFMSLFLASAPHFVILSYVFTQYAEKKGIDMKYQIIVLIEAALFTLYVWLKLSIHPVLIKQTVRMRIKIMMGGRRLSLYGLYAVIIQTLLFFFGYPSIHSLQPPFHILVINVIVAVLSVLLLLFNGILRILLTSRRLSVVRRIAVLSMIWIPVINIFVILYACDVVKQEFDHECYKVVNINARVDSQICSTKYPLVMVHGFGFRDLKYINYWGRIPKELIRHGATIYYGNQEAMASIEYNANDIKQKILEIITETNCGKVNIIAHSKGGLDSRYLISVLDMGDFVASLTTMSTPHRGSKVIDVLIKMPDSVFQAIAHLCDKYYRFIGDKNPDVYTSGRQLSTQYSEEFNEHVKDMPQVYYQSYATVMKSMFSDSLLTIPYCMVRPYERQNDGLVCIHSAQWGEFKGVLSNKRRRGISHGDIIDLKREDYKGFDVIEKYIEIVSDLKQKGF